MRLFKKTAKRQKSICGKIDSDQSLAEETAAEDTGDEGRTPADNEDREFVPPVRLAGVMLPPPDLTPFTRRPSRKPKKN